MMHPSSGGPHGGVASDYTGADSTPQTAVSKPPVLINTVSDENMPISAPQLDYKPNSQPIP